MRESTDKRQYFETFEEAARDFGLPLDNMDLARKVAAELPACDIYIPLQTRPYIAFKEPNGKRMVASIHSGYAWVRSDLAPGLGGLVHESNGWWGVDFPVNKLRDGNGSRSGGRWNIPRPVCDGCNMALPATGLCDNCDD